MNCQEVERAITDLARGIDSDESLLAHVRECGQCAGRLAEQRKLTTVLRAWAEESGRERAPVVMEEALLKVFRRGAVPARRSRPWIPFAAAAAIASIALLSRMFTPAAPVVQRVERPAEPVRAASAAPDPVLATPPVAPRRTKARPVRRAVPAPVQTEVDFITVAQGDAWTPLDGGRLVRVQLPRSAVRGFGLPVNEDRSLEKIQADVMLSNDGLLRAIRFVR